ncbi:putative uncharacterized protein [Prevotella sp. CAG:1124]|nr:putative uncharacterized protein [Prevotella sp. CAG:1124]
MNNEKSESMDDFNKKESLINGKTLKFALRIIEMVKYVRRKDNENVLTKQVLRSGTSIGASVRESEYAQSQSDFIHKLSISLKEANETRYWLCLLNKAGYIDGNSYESIKKDCDEIMAILIASIKTAKSHNQ